MASPTADQADELAQVDVFVRAAAGITGAFGLVTLSLGLIYDDRRRLLMTAVLVGYAVSLLACRHIARREGAHRAAFAIAALTLAGSVALALLHPAVHAALAMAALFPAAVALQFARGRSQWALLILSWLATICVGLAAEYGTPSVRVPVAVEQPFRLLAIASASGVFLMLLLRFANRLFDRVEAARAGQAAAAAATAALAAEHERLSVTLASIGEAVIVTDASGRVTLMNAPAERVAGVDLRGRPVVDACRFEDARGQARDPVTEALRDGRVIHGDDPLILVRHDGQRFHVYLSASPIRTGASLLIGSVIVLRDVSERVRLEEELREAQKLDAIGRLAGGVAHDFNNQLTSILGYAELLVWTFDEDDARREDMAEIRKAADRAALVTQQLLAFSRRQLLQPRLVHVPDVVTRSVRLLNRMLPGHIVLNTAIDADLAPVFIDPHQLGHALLNLAVSARDTMPDGGTLSIRASNVTVGASRNPTPGIHPATKPEAWVRLIVADTGTGISAERLPRVFEPFANQTQMFPGSLELAVVHGIVTQSGGTIQVRSEDGRGTTFTLDFPAAVDADGPEHEARPIGGRETILLVEDDAAVRALLASTLERQGYGVMAVHGAAEAMAPVPGSVQGLIVDLGQPDGRGGQIAGDLSRRFPGVPVVYIAGRPEADAAGADRPPGRLLQKPFTPRDLLVALRETLDSG